MRPRPGSASLVIRDVSAREVETINLHTYGWADRHVFGATHETLLAVRTASRQRPADVIRPKPFCQINLIEPDPDDDSLARENARRGWPEQLEGNGKTYDYIVIPTDRPHPELRARADELTERRARKRAGVGADEPFEGRIINNLLHPHDLA